MSPLPWLTKYSGLRYPTASAMGHMMPPRPWLSPCVAYKSERAWAEERALRYILSSRLLRLWVFRR
ncbi:MAG: hypothetical protein ABSG32_26405 [Terriglobia bacterium]|jgi:hypothetical protein